MSRGLGILGAFLKTLFGEGTFWRPWDHLGGPWAGLGRPWGHLWAPLGPPLGAFGLPWGPFGRPWGVLWKPSVSFWRPSRSPGATAAVAMAPFEPLEALESPKRPKKTIPNVGFHILGVVEGGPLRKDGKSCVRDQDPLPSRLTGVSKNPQ